MDNGQAHKAGAAEKSCIFILLCGGPSHLDTWDLKPDAPPEIRGPYKPIATSVPGMRLCELHPQLAKLAGEFCLIRSMTHPGNISNHFDAMHNSLSGQAGAPADSPYLGSILAKVRPSQRNVASYVWLIKCVGDPVFCAPNIGTGGSLGAVYAPCSSAPPRTIPPSPVSNHRTHCLPPSPRSACDGRRQLLDGLERKRRRTDKAQEWHDLHRRGFELATGRRTAAGL